MENQSQKYHISLLKDITILTTLVTILAYLITFSYQQGFNSYYKINDFFIDSITINQLLRSLLTIGIKVASFVLLVPFLHQLYKRDTSYRKSFMISHILNFWILVPIILSGFLYFYFPINKVQATVLYVIYLLIVAVPVLLAAFFDDEPISYSKRFHKKVITEGFNLTNLKRRLEKSPILSILILFTAIISIYHITNAIGYKNASEELEYYNLLIENQEYIVINRFEDSFIVAPFDRKSNSVNSEYSLFEISNLEVGEKSLYYVKLDEPPKIKNLNPKID